MHHPPAAPTARSFALIAAPALALALGACAMSSATPEPPKTVDGANYTGVPLVATMDGHGEVPMGDPDGSGEFALWVDTAQNHVCYNLGVAGIATPTAAHVHKGGPGVSGPPVVMLDAPATMHSENCMPVDGALAADLIAHPADYYVNVHTADYPGGAVRAQLAHR